MHIVGAVSNRDKEERDTEKKVSARRKRRQDREDIDVIASRTPAEIIQDLFDERRSWSDVAILADLKALPILPDEDDNAWDDDKMWRQGYLFVALAEVAASRRLRTAILLLLERASYGDPGSMMSGLKNNLEAIVNPNWTVLVDACIEAAQFPQRGARLWAVEELGRLRDTKAVPVLIQALHDDAHLVRLEACCSLKIVCRNGVQPDTKQKILTVLETLANTTPQADERSEALEAYEAIAKM